MKSKKFLAICCLILVILATNVCITHAFEGNADSASDVNAVSELINTDGVLSGELTFQESFENDAGQVLRLYSDDNYTYYVSEEKNEVFMISMQPAQMDSICTLFESTQTLPISEDQAEEIMLKVVRKMFPEYSISNLRISLDSETGSCIEYFRFYIEEESDDTLINIASISLAFNGQPSVISGTHNTIESFGTSTSTERTNDNSFILKEDLPNIVTSYIVGNLATLEESHSIEAYDFANEEYVASEGMLLPDGVVVGDTFTVEKLPQYRIYCENESDLQLFEAKKVMHSGAVMWEVRFQLNTSWGEFDPLLNLYVTMYIDPTKGSVVEMYSADS